MNKTVELVNQWAAFEENHPKGNIEDFCRHFLAKQEQQKTSEPLVGGIVPAFNDGLLLKIIGRISRLHMNYTNLALRDSELNQMEEYGVLQTIKQNGNPRKTEVIYANLLELSSGTDLLNRLKNRGLIKEYDDKEDKRSKRMKLTAKGEKVIEATKLKVYNIANLLMNDLTDDDKALCIQLLKNIEIKFSSLWQKHKGKDFDSIYAEVIG